MSRRDWTDSKRGWTESWRGWIVSRRDWTESRRDWTESRRDWTESRRGWTVSRRDWTESKRGWTESRRGWTVSRRHWTESRRGWTVSRSHLTESRRGWTESRRGCVLSQRISNFGRAHSRSRNKTSGSPRICTIQVRVRGNRRTCRPSIALVIRKNWVVSAIDFKSSFENYRERIKILKSVARLCLHRHIKRSNMAGRSLSCLS